MSKYEITAGGIYDNEGKEIPIGTMLTLKEEPTAWAGRYRVVGGKDDADKELIVNPAATAPAGPFEVRDAGSGWFALHDGEGAQIGKKLRKDDADAFATLSDEDKAAFAAEHAKD